MENAVVIRMTKIRMMKMILMTLPMERPVIMLLFLLTDALTENMNQFVEEMEKLI